MSDVVFDARDLAVGYGGHTVLRGVNLTVGAGDFWFLLGPNGAGKTTLLRTLMGLRLPLGGQLVRHPALGGLERIGFVPQRCDLNPSLPTTIREFVLLGLVGLRLGGTERQRRLAWALARVGLADFVRHDYWALSGGQRQRALLARALVREPAVLVLDEPTTGLDPSAEGGLLVLLKELSTTENRTIMFVTHDLGIAGQYASHVALFHGGSVVAGARDGVLTRDNLERIYGVPMALSVDSTNGTVLCVHAIGGQRH